MNLWMDKIQYAYKCKMWIEINIFLTNNCFFLGLHVTLFPENTRKILIFWLDNEITIRSHFYFLSSDWFPDLNNTICFITQRGLSREDWAAEDKWGEKLWSDFSPWWQLRLISRLWFSASVNIPPHQAQSALSTTVPSPLEIGKCSKLQAGTNVNLLRGAKPKKVFFFPYLWPVATFTDAT